MGAENSLIQSLQKENDFYKRWDILVSNEFTINIANTLDICFNFI
jgi:hypothetical protein